MKTTNYDPNSPKVFPERFMLSRGQESKPDSRLNPAPVEPIRKPLIACELDAMNIAMQDLHEELDRLSSRLQPLLPPPSPACPAPKDPQERIELPPLGEQLRGLRGRMEVATEVLREIRNNLEI